VAWHLLPTIGPTQEATSELTYSVLFVVLAAQANQETVSIQNEANRVGATYEVTSSRGREVFWILGELSFYGLLWLMLLLHTWIR
jgi:hypothetical protein